MKIAILGTRGVPNRYGGFEQNAENLSLHFVGAGHEVIVYTPDEHPFEERTWNGVRLRRIFCSERRLRLGVWGTLAYDYLCLRDVRQLAVDVILEMGYAPSAVFFSGRRNRRPKLVTNMDGLEWKRAKWNRAFRRFLRYCESRAVKLSDALIADNPGIQEYLYERYRRESWYIPYGAELAEDIREERLEALGLRKDEYFMLIARLEPENNIELILDGYVQSSAPQAFIVVGGVENPYGRFLIRKYAAYERIKFIGGLYDYDVLSSMRALCRLYFHGHSVGGTNPSLLEAMASGALIAAYDCTFNRHVLGSDGFFFQSAADVRRLITASRDGSKPLFASRNRKKIEGVYNWERVGSQYLEMFRDVLDERNAARSV